MLSPVVRKENPSRLAVGLRGLGGRKLIAGLLMPLVLAACSLGNVAYDECVTDQQCELAFGAGSRCDVGFCSAVDACKTGHDCRKLGGGACVEGSCVATLPVDPSGMCTTVEPANAEGINLQGPDAPMLVGGMFFLSGLGPPIRDGAHLALRQINQSGGAADGRKLVMVSCSNFNEQQANAYETNREEVIRGSIDYLVKTLGVPFAVGPLRSVDTVFAVDYLVKNQYPSVLISPSATSALLSGNIDKLSNSDELGMFWRTAPSDEFQAKVLAGRVIEYVGDEVLGGQAVGKVAVAYIQDEYGAGFQKTFQESFSGTVVPVPFKEDADVANIAQSFEASEADVMVYVDVEPKRLVALLAEIVARPNLRNKPLLLTDGSKNPRIFCATVPDDPEAPCEPASTEVLNYLVSRTVGTAPGPTKSVLYNTYQAEMSAEFGFDPADNVFTENAYDAVYAGAGSLVWAANEAKINGSGFFDGRNLAQGLLQLTSGAMAIDVGLGQWVLVKSGLTGPDGRVDLQGVSGDLNFDASGEVKAPIEIWRPSNNCSGNLPNCLSQVEVIPVDQLQ